MIRLKNKHINLLVILTTLIIGINSLKCTVRYPANNFSTLHDTKSRELVGRATCKHIFMIFKTGDCSIEKAMKNGGIDHIHHIDIEEKNYLFFKEVTTLVYGEGKWLSSHEMKAAEKLYSKIEEMEIGRPFLVQLKDGKDVAGFLEQKAKSVIILMDEDGKRTILKKNQIENLYDQ